VGLGGWVWEFLQREQNQPETKTKTKLAPQRERGRVAQGRLLKPGSHYANHITQRPGRHFNVQRDAFMPAIGRHHLHAGLTPQRLL
jgi:hypothetical protein